MLALKDALYEYQCIHGELPFSSEGEPEALFDLVPFVSRDALAAAAPVHQYVIDHEATRLEIGTLHYINRRDLAFGEMPSDLVVLSESTAVDTRGHWACFGDGSVRFVGAEGD